MHIKAHQSRSGTRRRIAVIGSSFALALGVLVAMPGANALPPDIFELDGNSVDSNGAATSPDDWDTLYNDGSAPFGHSAAFSGIIADIAGQTIFTTGGSKDFLDVPSWRHTAGSVPDKDEITNAYAAAYLAPDGGDPGTDEDLIIYFGSDRYAQNGSANVGFWFTEESVGPIAGGLFSGVHHTGDTLVLSEFTNGGAVSTIQVWEWAPGVSGPTCPSNVTAANEGCKDNAGTLLLQLASANADCDTSPAGAVACANVNSAEITVPWDYDAKGGGVQNGKVPAGGFFEGGVNLSALRGGARPCVSSFLAETRSSPSIDAVLKDFTGGAFPLCGANVQIAGNDINEVGDPHTFTVTANQVFAGVASPATVANVDVTLTDANGATPVINAAASTCDDNQPSGDNVDANGQCTIVFTSATTGTVTGNATAVVTVGGENFTVSTTGTGGNSGPVLKRFVDSKITLSPLTDTNGITENHVVTADVEVDLGDGNGFVTATVGHVDATTTASAGAVVTPNAGGTTCHISDPPDPAGADNLDANGQCTIAFTSNSAGTVTVHATVNLSVTVGGFTEAMTRSTDGTHGSSVDATKDFVDGTLVWLKHDNNGALLAGATFEVCRTHNWNSTTSAMVDITDVCVTVADDVLVDDPDATTPDADNDGGQFLLEDLILGRYTVRETIAPAGYALDPDTVTVDITIADTTGDAGTFVDTLLFKLIVITCNTATEELVDSTVTLTGTPGADSRETIKASELPGGVSEATLCGLAGANYDDLPEGTYAPSVEIPDKAPLFP